MITYLDLKDQNDINIKMKQFYGIGVNFSFIKSMMAKRLTKILKGIIHKLMH